MPWRRRLRNRERAHFYSQLAHLLDSGIDPVRALEMAPEPGPSLSERVGRGSDLVDAFGAEPQVGRLERAVVAAGSAAGALPVCLGRLGESFERRARAKSHLWAQLIYPLILIHAAFLLPPLSLFVSDDLSAYLRVAVVPLVTAWIVGGIGWLIAGRIRSAPSTARRLDVLLLRVPGVASAVRHHALASYAGALSLLLGAGVPLLEALDHAAQVVANRELSARCVRVPSLVRTGATLADAAASQLPRDFAKRVRVGEVSGRLEEQLDAASRHHEEAGAAATRRLVAFASAAAFGLAAVMVAFAVIRSWVALLPG